MPHHRSDESKKRRNRKRRTIQKRKRKFEDVPDLVYQLRDDDWCYDASVHPLVGRVAIDEGQDENGELWSVLARVEAVLFKEGSQDVELVRIRHRDGDFQDISPEAADEACHRAWATSDRSRRCVLLPVPRGERDKQGWDAFWANYIKGNNGRCYVHVAYNKVPLGGEINIEHGIADISLCLSLVRNSKSERAVAGDLVILLVSSNNQSGIRYKGVVRTMVLLEQQGSVADHHNYAARRTSIYHVVGESFFHRNQACRYHLDATNMSRDSSGIVWYSGCYAHVTPFNGIHASHLNVKMPDPLRTALEMKHPIAKSRIMIERKLARDLMLNFREFEKTPKTNRNLPVEELELRNA